MTATTLAPLPVGTPLTYANTAGRVLATREKNGYDDSDFLAVVAFDAPDGGYVFGQVETGSTRYAGGFIARPNVTDPDLIAAYEAKRDEVYARLAADRAEAEARNPEVGKTVTIVRPVTRGKNKTEAGVTGTVARKVENTYGKRYGGYAGKRYRLAVLLDEPGDARTVWLDDDRVRVQGYESDRDLPDLSRVVDYVIAEAWPAVQPPR
jgi:hypothetical protein